MSVVGIRLKTLREASQLSLRQFADELDEDFTLLARIEAGKRFPPKPRIEKFASLLSLTTDQLQALISVERAGLDPCELLPEIPPGHITPQSMENAAHRLLRRYSQAHLLSEVKIPVPVADVIKDTLGLSTDYLDLADADLSGSDGSSLYGCLFPNGKPFRGKDKLVLVNTGRIRGRRLSVPEQAMTIAHEAGHYVLHCGNQESQQLFFRFTKAPSFCREVGYRKTRFNLREHQATEFAACLLMPQLFFMSRWKAYSGDASALANLFSVTQSFVRFRAKTLQL